MIPEGGSRLFLIRKYRPGGFVPRLYVLSRNWGGTDVRTAGRCEDRTKLLVSYDDCPEIPLCVAGIIPLRDLAVLGPRVAYYLGDLSKRGTNLQKKQYATAYVLGWSHATAASLTVEYDVYNRVWVCDERCVEVLRNHVSFDDFVVDDVGEEIEVFSFHKSVSLLEKAREMPQNFHEIRVD